ncbi:hypothetical protein JCM33374_g5014 [Metschnikowia sp. JCM 33374]|nr:hypothetical protein JCM33374_g5014 [Metschnikowia sp. JCM 33374]
MVRINENINELEVGERMRLAVEAWIHKDFELRSACAEYYHVDYNDFNVLADKAENHGKRNMTSLLANEDLEKLMVWVTRRVELDLAVRTWEVCELARILLLRERTSYPTHKTMKKIGNSWIKHIFKNHEDLAVDCKYGYIYSNKGYDITSTEKFFNQVAKSRPNGGFEDGSLYVVSESTFHFGPLVGFSEDGNMSDIDPLSSVTILECMDVSGRTLSPFIARYGRGEASSDSRVTYFSPESSSESIRLEWLKTTLIPEQKGSGPIVLIPLWRPNKISAHFQEECDRNNIVPISIPSDALIRFHNFDLSTPTQMKTFYEYRIKKNFNDDSDTWADDYFHVRTLELKENQVKRMFAACGIEPWGPSNILNKCEYSRSSKSKQTMQPGSSSELNNSIALESIHVSDNAEDVQELILTNGEEIVEGEEIDNGDSSLAGDDNLDPSLSLYDTSAHTQEPTGRELVYGATQRESPEYLPFVAFQNTDVDGQRRVSESHLDGVNSGSMNFEVLGSGDVEEVVAEIEESMNADSSMSPIGDGSVDNIVVSEDSTKHQIQLPEESGATNRTSGSADIRIGITNREIIPSILQALSNTPNSSDASATEQSIGDSVSKHMTSGSSSKQTVHSLEPAFLPQAGDDRATSPCRSPGSPSPKRGRNIISSEIDPGLIIGSHVKRTRRPPRR